MDANHARRPTLNPANPRKRTLPRPPRARTTDQHRTPEQLRFDKLNDPLGAATK